MTKCYCDRCGIECKENDMGMVRIPTENLNNGSYSTKEIEVCPACAKEHDRINDMIIDFKIFVFSKFLQNKGE